jgi:hypothetical protein
METFLLELAVAVIPLILLIASVNLISAASRRNTHRPLAKYRRRRNILRSLAHGVLLR